MTRLLAPIALPLAGALFCALVAALLGLWWSVTSHAETRAERDAALARIEFILTAQGIEADVQNLSDDEFRRELVERLQRRDR